MIIASSVATLTAQPCHIKIKSLEENAMKCKKVGDFILPLLIAVALVFGPDAALADEAAEIDRDTDNAIQKL